MCWLCNISPLLAPLSLHTGRGHWRWWEDLQWPKTRGYVSVGERENERNNTLNTTNCKKKTILKPGPFSFSFIKEIDLTRPVQEDCMILKINGHHFQHRTFFFNYWQADLSESTSYSATSSGTLNCVDVSWPLTVSVTSVSPTPIRGTMALHTYWPASAWLTDFRYSWLLLLRTCGGVNKEDTNINKANLLNSRRG